MYKITASEDKNETATEYETKSMLFLMNYFENSNSIDFFVIDFFNDVSGIDKMCTKCYDVQSKGISNITPTKLGEYSVTLFKNFVSSLNFSGYILFLKGVSKTVEKQIGTKTFFMCKDLNDEINESIKAGLKKSADEKKYFDSSYNTDSNLNAFLEKIIFVIDSHSIDDYIRDAVSLNSTIAVESVYLKKIFKEIRNNQSSKKNNNVEGEEIDSFIDFFKYDKYISRESIESLITQRICFSDVLKDSNKVPIYFLPELKGFDDTIVTDTIESCFHDVVRLLVDKNNKDAFWSLFDEIRSLILSNPSFDANTIYSLVNPAKILDVRHLTPISCKYFISLIKERMK